MTPLQRGLNRVMQLYWICLLAQNSKNETTTQYDQNDDYLRKKKRCTEHKTDQGKQIKYVSQNCGRGRSSIAIAVSDVFSNLQKMEFVIVSGYQTGPSCSKVG